VYAKLEEQAASLRKVEVENQRRLAEDQRRLSETETGTL
jgi:hypothetical protein